MEKEKIKEMLEYMKKEPKLNPNYLASLIKAIDIDIENVSIPSDINEDTKKDINRLKAFIEYAKNEECIKYKNIFEILKFNEPSISKFLVMLLNVDGKDENSIQYKFCSEFFKYLKDNKIINSDWDKLDIKNTKAYSKGTENVDIIVKTNKFILAIENKKNATFSCSKDGQCRRMQVEVYKNKEETLKTNFHSDKIYYIYLCANKLVENIDIKFRLSDRPLTEKNEQKLKDIKYKDLDYKKFSNYKIKDILSELNYSIIEHKDIAKILFNILDYDKYFITLNEDKYFITLNENKILKPTTYDELKKNIFPKIINLYNEGTTRTECVEFKFDRIRNIEIVKYVNDIKPILKIGKHHLFFNRLNEIQDLDIKTLIHQYIEYWELHYDVGSERDNVQGYTKIIDGEYIHDVCMRLYKNTDVFNKFHKDIKILIIEMIKETLFNETMMNLCEEFCDKDNENKFVIDHQLGWYELCFGCNNDDYIIVIESVYDPGKINVFIWSNKMKKNLENKEILIYNNKDINLNVQNLTKDNIRKLINDALEKLTKSETYKSIFNSEQNIQI